MVDSSRFGVGYSVRPSLLWPLSSCGEFGPELLGPGDSGDGRIPGSFGHGFLDRLDDTDYQDRSACSGAPFFVWRRRKPDLPPSEKTDWSGLGPLSPMKICLLSYRGNPYCGGQGVYLYFLSRELAKMGHSLTILVGPPEPWPMPWAQTIPRGESEPLGGTKKFYSFLGPLENFSSSQFFRIFGYPLRLFPGDAHLQHSSPADWKKYSPDSFRRFSRCSIPGVRPFAAEAFRRPLVTTVHHPLTIDFPSVWNGTEISKKNITRSSFTLWACSEGSSGVVTGCLLLRRRRLWRSTAWRLDRVRMWPTDWTRIFSGPGERKATIPTASSLWEIRMTRRRGSSIYSRP